MNECLIHSGLGRTGAVLAAAVILLDSHFLGMLASRCSGIRLRHPVLSSIVSTLIGLDIIIAISYLAGLAGLVSGSILEYILLAIAAASIFEIAFRARKKFISTGAYLRRNLPFIIILALAVLLTFGNSLCLPICWDELCYQLAIPKRWLQDGRILFYPDNPYSGFPGAGNFLFLACIYLGGLQTARIIVWVMWLLSIISLYHIIRGVSPTLKTALVFSFCLSGAVLMSSSSAYVEIIILLHFLCAYAIIENSRGIPAPGNCAALGLICGTASAVKLTGLAVGGAFFVLLAWAAARRKLPAKHLGLFIATILIVLGLYYSRPWTATGNPLYPYFAGIFPSGTAAEETSVYHHLAGNMKYGVAGITGFFSAPVLLGLPVNAYDGTYGLQFIAISALFVFSLFHLLRKGTFRKIPNSFLLLAMLYTFWFFTAQQARFFILAAAIFHICASICLKQGSRIPRVIALASLALAVYSFPNVLLEYFARSWKVVAGTERPVDFVYAGTGEGYLQAMDMARLRTPPDAKFLLLFENRGLYMPRRYENGTPFFQEKYFTPPEKYSSGDKIMEVLHSNGITHLLVGLSLKDPDRMDKYLERTLDFSAAIGTLSDKGELRMLWHDNGFAIFEVTTR